MTPGPNEVYGALDLRFPFDSAYDSDNSGWQIMGTREIERCLVALDPSPPIIERAIAWDAQLVITHHPLFFPHVTMIAPDSAQGEIVRALLAHEIGLLAVHTNADRHPEGISGALADALGLAEQTVLAPDAEESFFKLVTFVPDDHLADVRRALASAGAGVIGNYVECSFSLAGMGTYQPQKGAKPLTGEVGKLEEAEEQRLEMRVPEHLVGEVLNALRHAHPYDEVAYDMFRTQYQGGYLGLGVIGRWPDGLDLEEALQRIKEPVSGAPLIVTGPESGRIETVAVAGGGTDELIGVAAARGADLFVGGDLKYHRRIEHARRMVCVDAGHRATEQPGVDRLAEVVKAAAVQHGWELEVEVMHEPAATGRIV